MKIKTITCHDVYNAGASLQAYALQTYLEGLGHDVEIIDYKPEYLRRHYSFGFVPNPYFDRPILKQIYLLLKFPQRLIARVGKRKENFDLFKNQNLHLTKRYNSYFELQQDPPMADVYFAGSDQIWNPVFENGKDAAFYLMFAPQYAIRASYAASFAVDHIEQEHQKKVVDWLRQMDYISVREMSGVKIIEDMGIKNTVVVADPVFLLERWKWKKLCVVDYSSERYILVYDFDQNKQMEILAKRIAEKYGLKIFSLQRLQYADVCFDQAGPQEFLSLIYYAEYVISNSFHATAFSVLFKKEFLVFNRAEKINTRMQDFVEYLGIPQRLVVDEINIEAMMKIDYSMVCLRLQILIDASKKYINRVLLGVEQND